MGCIYPLPRALPWAMEILGFQPAFVWVLTHPPPTICENYSELLLKTKNKQITKRIIKRITSNKNKSNMNKFEIQAYTKKELALLYFPSAEPHTAVNRLMSWVKRCKPLHMALIAQGYKKTAKWLSPREVALVVEHLGEPWAMWNVEGGMWNGCRWQCGMLKVEWLPLAMLNVEGGMWNGRRCRCGIIEWRMN